MNDQSPTPAAAPPLDPATHTPSGKRRIARTSVEANLVTIQFSPAFGDTKITFDAATVPGALQIPQESVAARILAYGVGMIVQSAYANAEDPVAATRTALDKVTAGTWTPGATFTGAPDELVLATAEFARHGLPGPGKPGYKEDDPRHQWTADQWTDYIEDVWLPGQVAAEVSRLTKEGATPGQIKFAPGSVRKRLRSHPGIAPIIARIMADRAREAAKRAKATTRTEATPDLAF